MSTNGSSPRPSGTSDFASTTGPNGRGLVGCDNAKGKRTLGSGQTGSRVALPIFDRIMQTVWALYAPKTELAEPSPEAAEHLVALPINVRSGTRLAKRSRDGFMEYFKVDVDCDLARDPVTLKSQHEMQRACGWGVGHQCRLGTQCKACFFDAACR